MHRLEKHNSLKEQFLATLAILLQSHEWSNDVLYQTEQALGLKAGYHRLIFINGISEIVTAFAAWLDEQMLINLKTQEQPSKIRERIALALETRIICLVSQKTALSTCSFCLLPSHLSLGMKILYNSCNKIWYYAGDRSIDFNFYTKRSLLMSIYASSQAFYLADNSERYQDTKLFIRKCLDGIINFSSIKNKIKLPKQEDIPIIRLFA